MRDEAFLRQARDDAERIRSLPSSEQDRLNRETDWRGYRMRGYEFPEENTRLFA